MFKRSNVVLLVFLTFLTSCSTMSSLKRGDGGSTFTVKGKKYSEVWKAANRVMAQQLSIVSADKDLGEIKAEKGAGMTTWGEVVGVFITPPKEGSPEYLVEVQSLKRSKLQITGQDWENTVVHGMKAELED